MKILFAYQAAVAPSLAGFYFNARELVRRLTPAPAELVARLEAITRQLDGRKQETINLVLLGEARAIQAGMQEAPPRPQSYQDFENWAKTLTSFVEAEAKKQPREHAAFLLGWIIGDLSTSLALRSLVGDLLATSPEHKLLNEQHATLRASEKKALPNLELQVQNPGLPEAARAHLASMLPVAKTLETMADPQAVLHHLSAERIELEKTLT